MNSDVWINGILLGRRPNGYVSFAYDITRHLVRGVNQLSFESTTPAAQFPLVHRQRLSSSG